MAAHVFIQNLSVLHHQQKFQPLDEHRLSYVCIFSCNFGIGHLQDSGEILDKFIDVVGDTIEPIAIEGDMSKVKLLQGYILHFDDGLGK